MRVIKVDDVKELLIGLDSLPWEEEVDDLLKGLVIEVQPVVHGYWESCEDSWICSECGEENCYAYAQNLNKFTDSYCPNCGAKMDRKK